MEQMSSECITDLVFRSEPEEKKFPMYRSIFSKKVREELRRSKDCHRTFGLPREMIFPTPLKKGTRKVIRPDVDKTKPNLPPKMKVPKREEWATSPPRQHPNFLLKNVLDAVRMKPPQGPSRVFDTALGRRIHDCNLLIPKFVFRKGFGKVPKYLLMFKKQQEELLAAHPEVESVKEDTMGIRLVPEEERQSLLNSLKKAWEELTKEFQLLPTVVDSVPMIKKKRNLERSLEQLEKDIDMVENHKYIYVFDTKTTCCVRP